MNKAAISALSAIFGGIIGAFVMNRVNEKQTIALLKEKEKKVTSYYIDMLTKMMDEKKEEPVKEEPPIQPVSVVLNDIVSEQNYKSSKDTTSKEDAPYPIKPEEYGESMQYDQISLKYWSDNVLTDDQNKVLSVDDINEWVGSNYANLIGMYEEDSIHIRNDAMLAEFEIIAQYKPFSLVRDTIPKEPRGPLDD